MQRWKLTLAYDGSAFHGWQVQPSLPTVQGTLASALRGITGEASLPQGSGRTDAGVHALAQVATVDLAAPIPPANLLRALNRALPPAIRVLSADHAPASFHARHSALRKTYEYRLFAHSPARRDTLQSVCSPFVAPYAWDCPWPFDLAAAQAAAAHILGEHDFTSFAASDPDLATRSSGEAPSNFRAMCSSAWHSDSALFVYRVTGSGFLHHMVRNLVGTFVDAAARRIDPDSIPAILAGRDRSLAGPTAPARGLFLVGVEYAPHDEAPV
jgi:tRNA pseudouridine38-40 synthase